MILTLNPPSRFLCLLLSIAGLLAGVLMAFSGDEMLSFISIFLIIPSGWFVILNSNESFLNVRSER